MRKETHSLSKMFYGIWSEESDYPHWIGLWPREGLFTEHLCIAHGALRAMRGAMKSMRNNDAFQIYLVGDDGLPTGEPQ